MALEFRFPDVGEGIHEGEIVRWLVHEGDSVRPDQPVVEIETDKAVVEIPAPRAGTVLHMARAAGQKIQVGDILLVIGAPGEYATSTSQAVSLPTQAASVSVVGSLDIALTDLPPSPDMPPPTPPLQSQAPKRLLAIPSVRKLARDLGVDLAQVTPTGPQGRIRREDVLQAASQPTSPVTAPVVEAMPPSSAREQDAHGAITHQPLSALRRSIARAMVNAATTTVPVTTTDEADVTELLALREQSRAAAAAQHISLTLLPFLMKAVVAALRQHPQLNASMDETGNRLILKHYYHLGVATDTPDGLLVPVIKDVDTKSLLSLATELERLTALARTRRIALPDLRGHTFTISNYGAVGGLFATPMLHLPDVAILGVGKILRKPVVQHDAIAIRMLLPLSLTFDHRALDGAEAQRFLNSLIDYLSTPARLILTL